MMNSTLKKRPNPTLVLVALPKKAEEIKTDSVKGGFYEFVMNNPLARDVTQEFGKKIWDPEEAEFAKTITIPSDKWVANPPIVIKAASRSKAPIALYCPSDDPELVKEFHKRGIVSQETGKPKTP
jgi:hypothetical protein